MKRVLKIFCALAALAALFVSNVCGQAPDATEKPWTYWWWMGSSVNEEDITEQLEGMAQAGLGGVHIIPIYGEKGDEENFIAYLSERWMEVLEHTIREARRLGMDVDMTMGTGWPFGGADIPQGLQAQRFKIDEGQYVTEPTRQMVKRAAPGAEGFVIDHFNRAAIEYYTERFKDAFSKIELRPRALYNDSFEVYGANSTTNFLEKFKALRGYDLQDHLDMLDEKSTDELKPRLLSDYCETVSELLYSEFTEPWVEICHKMGVGLVRNEAHGSPGNLLDLYAAADIPETESFGASALKIPGLRQDPKYEEKRFGRPDPLTMKFASSAAHLSGKPLVSSESTTWLGDHFSVAFSQIKPQLDELFTAGINHIFFHGTTYSPYWKGFPGRLFYASTHYGHTSHFWEEMPVLTSYIRECQRILQSSQADHDILLYFPIYDIWSKGGGRGVIKLLDVHYLSAGLKEMAFGQLAGELWERGYTFDYVSDRMLQNHVNAKGKVILVPPTQYMPLETLEALQRYAGEGSAVIFIDSIAEDVPGLFQFEERRALLSKQREELQKLPQVDIVKAAGSSQEMMAQLSRALSKSGIYPEPFKAMGIDFIRKTIQGRSVYFLANLSEKPGKQWIRPMRRADKVLFYNPESKVWGEAAARTGNGGKEFLLHLPQGESLFLFCEGREAETLTLMQQEKVEPWPYYGQAEEGEPILLDGAWTLRYSKGVPEIEGSLTTEVGKSWTTLGEPYDIFSGKLVYSRKFKLSASEPGRVYELDLGDVRETASVRLNGELLPLYWHIPFTKVIPLGLLKEENTLEIEVTNLSYNRVIELDRKKVPWKNFHEINFVNIQYKPFDASEDEPLPSGLLSTPRLIPLAPVGE